MRVESLTCNHCGGPLEVPESANAVRCNHCGSQLAVRRESSVTYTELIHQVVNRTDRLTDQVVQLTYENELMRIDQDWERERDSHMVTSKHGAKSEPSVVLAAITACLGCGGAIVFTVTGHGLLGIPALVICFVIALVHWSKAEAYEAAKRRYQLRRSGVSVDRIREGLLTQQDRQSSDSFPKLNNRHSPTR